MSGTGSFWSSSQVKLREVRREQGRESLGRCAQREDTSMNRYSLAGLAAAVASAIALGPSALAQALHSAGPQAPTPEQALPASTATSDQPPSTGAIPMPTSP